MQQKKAIIAFCFLSIFNTTQTSFIMNAIGALFTSSQVKEEKAKIQKAFEEVVKDGIWQNAIFYLKCYDHIDLNVELEDGKNALHLAVIANNRKTFPTKVKNLDAAVLQQQAQYAKEIIPLLISKGIDINHQDKTGATAYWYAESTSDAYMMSMLKEARAGIYIFNNDKISGKRSNIGSKSALPAPAASSGNPFSNFSFNSISQKSLN